MQTRLFKVTRKTLDNALRLQDAARLLHPPFSPEEQYLAGHILIEASSLWQNFLRRYYLVSAIGGRLTDGSFVTGSGVAGSGDEALDKAIYLFRRNAVKPSSGWSYRDEPDWLDPVIAYRAMDNLNLSVAGQFANAMTRGTGSHQDLQTCRNFFAHRNRGTAIKVQNVAHRAGVPGARLPGGIDPHHAPFLPGLGRPQCLILDWLDEIVAIVENVAQ